MRIIVVSNLYPPYQLGGYEIACKNLVNGLRSLGHEVHVMTSPSHLDGGGGQEHVSRCMELRAFQPVTSDISHAHFESAASNYTNTSLLLDRIREFRPDCVFLFNIYGLGGLALLDALNSLEFPWVMYLMDRLPEMLQHRLNPALLALYQAGDFSLYRSGKFISISRHLLREITTMCRTGFPFDADFIPAWSDADERSRQRVHAADGTIRFVNAGALKPHKGIHIIIEAAALLKERTLRDFTINFYGEGDQGYYIDLCKQNQVSSRVFFNGLRSQEELMRIYLDSDVFLFPTHHREPFAFAPVEAAAAGCVPIISNLCGNAERFVHNVHCLKVSRDPNSLADAMALVCESPSILRPIAQNAQSLTRQDLSFSHCLDRVERVLKTTLFRKKFGRIPTWRDFNLAYLKHNLAIKLSK